MTVIPMGKTEIFLIDADRVDRVLDRLAFRRDNAQAVYRDFFQDRIDFSQRFRETLRTGKMLTVEDRQALLDFERTADPLAIASSFTVLWDTDTREEFPAAVVPIGSRFCIGGYRDGPHPYTRESKEEWATRGEAQAALETGAWTKVNDRVRERPKAARR